MSNKQTEQDPQRLRAAAEADLARTPDTAVLVRDNWELLHELRVHQIELEMQNEQLRQAQIALEESRDRYVDLYEFAPVGYLTLTDAGMISEINLTGSTLLKMERKKLLHRRFDSFVDPEYRDRWNQLFTGMSPQSGVNCELAMKNGEGERFYAQLNCMRLTKEGAARVVRITLTDTTHLRQAEEVMREWQRFVECAHWGMTIGSLNDRTIKLTNPAYARMHGYTMEELHGLTVDSLYAPESRANLTQYDEILRSAGCYTFECMRLRKDGSTFPAVVDISTIEGTDGKNIYVASVTDITARRQMERRLRDLTAHLQTVREEEKNCIAREIHDELGGTLTALKMEAYWLAGELSAHNESTPLLEHIELMARLIDNATNATRRIITGLRPSLLDDLGLLAALEWQAAQFHKRTGIECRVNCVADEDCVNKVDKTQSINLFRIFQEALTNISQHSFASKVEVEFHPSNEGVFLSICDNGCGITENHIYTSSSYGILGMTERVEQLGGTIKFGSMPNGGLSVTVNLPPAGNIKMGAT